MNDIYRPSTVYNCSLHTELNAVPLVAAHVHLFLIVDQGAHLAHHAGVLGVEGEHDAVDEEHEAHAEQHYEVGLALSEEHVGAAVDVIGEVVVGDPHVGEVHAEGEEEDADEQDPRPELGVGGELEGHQHHHRGETA